MRDVSGDERYELTIAGPGKLVDEVLGDATIEVTIDSAQSTEDLKRRFDELRAEHRKQLWSAAGLENIDDLFKPEPASPERDTSVLMAVRPVSGEGTPFAITAAGFTVPATVSVFFVGSWVFFANGAVAAGHGRPGPQPAPLQHHRAGGGEIACRRDGARLRLAHTSLAVRPASVPTGLRGSRIHHRRLRDVLGNRSLIGRRSLTDMPAAARNVGGK